MIPSEFPISTSVRTGLEELARKIDAGEPVKCTRITMRGRAVRDRSYYIGEEGDLKRPITVRFRKKKFPVDTGVMRTSMRLDPRIAEAIRLFLSQRKP